jgi:hypothetical protein
LEALLLWLIEKTAERGGLHERMRLGGGKRRAYARLFPAEFLLTLKHCRTTIDGLVDAIESPDQWVATDH